MHTVRDQLERAASVCGGKPHLTDCWQRFGGGRRWPRRLNRQLDCAVPNSTTAIAAAVSLILVILATFYFRFRFPVLCLEEPWAWSHRRRRALPGHTPASQLIFDKFKSLAAGRR